jgi:predicted ArsR family transcriptional regulator
LHNRLCTITFALVALPRRELTDLLAVRALAHPRRQMIMQQLGAHGPATSAELGRRLGLNTGATSYHLRELAKHGFIEAVPEQGHGRERWWRAVASDFRFPRRSQQDAPLRAAIDEATRLAFAADVDALVRHSEQARGEWADAAMFSRGTVRVTPDELLAFFEEYIALVNRYAHRDEEPRPGAKPVAARLLVFPINDEDDTNDEEEA